MLFVTETANRLGFYLSASVTPRFYTLFSLLTEICKAFCNSINNNHVLFFLHNRIFSAKSSVHFLNSLIYFH